jgi:ATP synthase protein I
VLTRQEAQALRARLPSVSPWRVILVQAVVGVVVAALVWLVTGERPAALSALYGAAVVVVPGALMARGMTSRLSHMNPGTGAVSFMLWETTKIAVSVAMLMLAPKLVQPLSWPALLVAMVLCMKVYWLALLWRGR